MAQVTAGATAAAADGPAFEIIDRSRDESRTNLFRLKDGHCSPDRMCTYKDARLREKVRGKCILVVGEGSKFTFSTALMAVLGAGRTDIIATMFEGTAPKWCDAKQETLNGQKRNAQIARTCETAGGSLEQASQAVSNLDEPEGSMLTDVDGTNLKETLDAMIADRVQIVWFQCPFALAGDEAPTRADIVTKFASSVYEDTRAELMIIGINDRFSYSPFYGLADLLSGEKFVKMWEFIGGDKSLVHELIDFGYVHEGRHDIHDDMVKGNEHLTLCFQRRRVTADQRCGSTGAARRVPMPDVAGTGWQ